MKLIFCIFFLIPGKIFSQDFSEAIKADADKMNIAFLKGDVNTILDYTYPKIFEVIGNREFMAELISSYLDEMQADGYVLDTAIIGTPGKVYIAGDELHAVVMQTIYSTFPGGTLKNDVPLLAISMDKGVNWYFVDMRQVTPELLAKLFPAFNHDLKIPPVPEPVIIDTKGNIRQD